MKDALVFGVGIGAAMSFLIVAVTLPGVLTGENTILLEPKQIFPKFGGDDNTCKANFAIQDTVFGFGGSRAAAKADCERKLARQTVINHEACRKVCQDRDVADPQANFCYGLASVAGSCDGRGPCEKQTDLSAEERTALIKGGIPPAVLNEEFICLSKANILTVCDCRVGTYIRVPLTGGIA